MRDQRVGAQVAPDGPVSLGAERVDQRAGNAIVIFDEQYPHVVPHP
ncbi:hypothetical protein GCM10023321_42670 [Pseudonocardia eucalypti]|uniref:Uncharacterized protein n=1 Tax=Pseudonocardia eucalypti TaxID=648755 RepID=A0ABP9QDX4_9PSEU